MSYDIHQTPGRLRIRTPLVKYDVAQASAARALLVCIDGVTSVRCSTGTGSITVAYDVYAVTAASLINALARQGYLAGIVGFPRPLPVRPRGVAVAASSVRVLSPQARRWLSVAARIVLPVLAERAFGRPARILVAGLL